MGLCLPPLAGCRGDHPIKGELRVIIQCTQYLNELIDTRQMLDKPNGLNFFDQLQFDDQGKPIFKPPFCAVQLKCTEPNEDGLQVSVRFRVGSVFPVFLRIDTYVRSLSNSVCWWASSCASSSFREMRSFSVFQ